MIYTMHIEKPAGTVKMHGFHLGTQYAIARDIVLERLRADPDVVSISLRQGDALVKIFDHRDVE